MPPTESSTTPKSTGYQGTARPKAPPRGFTARRGGHSSSISRNSPRVSKEKMKCTPPPSDSDSDSDTECDIRPTNFADKKHTPAQHPIKPTIIAAARDIERQHKKTSAERQSNPSINGERIHVLSERQMNPTIFPLDKDIVQPPKEVPVIITTISTDCQHKEALAERQTNFTISPADKDIEQQQKRKQLLAEQRASTISTADKDIERQQKPKPAPIQIAIPPQDEGTQQQLQNQLVSAQAMDSERRIMARSIIAGFPRRALESLLLDAALGNTSVMKEVIEWNSKNPVEETPRSARPSKCHPPSNNLVDNDTIAVEPQAIMIDDDEDFSYSFQAYDGFRATATHISAPGKPKVRKFTAKPVNPTSPVTPNPILLATRDSNTAQKLSASMQAAKRRREQGEEYVAPVILDRSKRRKTDDDPDYPDDPKIPEPRVKLTQPLSELTKEMDHIPLVDIEAYVNRPIAER
ncbi:uncharacterized protein PAC_07706 [Phialocephala subalpina]|uniref:Uncharacterized protein n=1 Tax=Phialocephala subalpina TaxID=576137 RepID=A0A1L7WYG9_9HELO|nr:uncharacterized protein PAC_07706 [Phialocephala subalpina]